MNQNDITILKYAVMEGVVNALSSIESTKKPTRKAEKPQKHDTPKADAKSPHTDKAKRERHDSYRIDDLRALYKLADAELLDKINGAIESKKYPGTRLYFIDKTPETKSALAVFLSQEEIAENV